MFLKGVNPLVLYDVNRGGLWSQCKGNWPHLNLILGTIKQLEAPYVFDWENAIALDTMQGNRSSSPRKGKVSRVFSSCGRNLGYILELQRGCPFETLVCSLKSGTV